MSSTGEPNGIDIINKLLQIGTTEAADALVRLGSYPDKTVAKEARRALHILAERGVHPSPVTEAATPSATQVTDEVTAYLTVAGADGTSVVAFIQDAASGQATLGLAELTRSGLGELTVRQATDQDLQWLQQRLLRQSESIAAVVPTEYAAWLVRSAGVRQEASGGLLPSGYSRMLGLAGISDAAEVPCPVYDTIGLEALTSDYSFSRDAARLFEQPAIRRWSIPVPIAEQWADTVMEAMQTRLVLSPQQLASRADRVITQAADAIFTQEDAAYYAVLLEEAALIFLAMEQAEPARQCLHHAVTVRGTESPGQADFLQTLVKRTVFAIVQARAQQERAAQERMGGGRPQAR